jgi:hypothetical protein
VASLSDAKLRSPDLEQRTAERVLRLEQLATKQDRAERDLITQRSLRYHRQKQLTGLTDL